MADVQKQIFAFGDGGTDSENPLMDLYIIAQSKKINPKVCFLGTASGDNQGYINYFERLFKQYPCKPVSLSLFSPHTKDISDFIMGCDIIYVGGGQSRSMLGTWREWSLDKILIEAYHKGVILSGGSAGSICWFESCISDSEIPGTLSVMNRGLGILPYSNCPHFASQSRKHSYAKHIKENKIKSGYAADDYAGLHFVNGKLLRSVSSRPYANTWQLGMEEGKFFQKRLETKWLGLKEYQQEFIWGNQAFSDNLKKESEEFGDDEWPMEY